MLSVTPIRETHLANQNASEKGLAPGFSLLLVCRAAGGFSEITVGRGPEPRRPVASKLNQCFREDASPCSH